MIPKAYITEWSHQAPWQTDEQIEQDLIICRALVEIFSDSYLADRLAFRGGTALHKLFLKPPSRYSEDIDLVQTKEEPIGKTFDRLREALEFLGEGSVDMGDPMQSISFNFESESMPTIPLKLKVEINTREHFSVLDWVKKSFDVDSEWFSGQCELTTYKLEELLGTKLRALYERKKGRDLYDLYKGITEKEVDCDVIVKCYEQYINTSSPSSPSRAEFIENIEEKMSDSEFLGDIEGLIRPEIEYDHDKSYETVKEKLIDKI